MVLLECAIGPGVTTSARQRALSGAAAEHTCVRPGSACVAARTVAPPVSEASSSDPTAIHCVFIVVLPSGDPPRSWKCVRVEDRLIEGAAECIRDVDADRGRTG